MMWRIGVMRLKKIYIENFRGYKERTEITFEDITTLMEEMMQENQQF